MSVGDSMRLHWVWLGFAGFGNPVFKAITAPSHGPHFTRPGRVIAREFAHPSPIHVCLRLQRHGICRCAGVHAGAHHRFRAAEGLRGGEPAARTIPARASQNHIGFKAVPTSPSPSAVFGTLDMTFERAISCDYGPVGVAKPAQVRTTPAQPGSVGGNLCRAIDSKW